MTYIMSMLSNKYVCSYNAQRVIVLEYKTLQHVCTYLVYITVFVHTDIYFPSVQHNASIGPRALRSESNVLAGQPITDESELRQPPKYIYTNVDLGSESEV